MRSSNTSLLLMLSLALPLAAQIVPPSLGVASRAGHPPIEVQGLPGSWVAAPALDAKADSASSSSVQRCWVLDGVLNVFERRTGETRRFSVARGSARFAFDSYGSLAALLALDTREIYSANAGWMPVFTLPEAAESLDLTVARGGPLTVLYRDRGSLHRTRIDGLTGDVLSDAVLKDQPGPALLGANGLPVFASDSGLAEVASMQRVEQGWMLLSTPRSLWLWRPGSSPQSLPLANGPAPVLQIWPFNSSLDVGDTISFPNTAPGYVAKLEFLIVNTGAKAVDISTLHLTTAAPFSLFERPSVPWSLQGGQFATLGIQFAPSAAGSFVSSLTLNERSVNVAGNAAGSAAPLQPAVILSQTQLTSNMTAQVGVKLNQKSPNDQMGLLSLTFTPAFVSVADDPAIQLTGNQQVTRAQPFKVPAGSDTAQFGADNFVTLSTGTTAGSLTLNASLGAQTGSQTLAVAPAVPFIASATRKNTTDGVVLTFQGFDNARSVSSVSFTFYTSSGAVVSPGALAADVSQDFSRYFQANPQAGGNFQLTATFAATGDVSAIASASAVFQNSAGTTTVGPK